MARFGSKARDMMKPPSQAAPFICNCRPSHQDFKRQQNRTPRPTLSYLQSARSAVEDRSDHTHNGIPKTVDEQSRDSVQFTCSQQPQANPNKKNENGPQEGVVSFHSSPLKTFSSADNRAGSGKSFKMIPDHGKRASSLAEILAFLFF